MIRLRFLVAIGASLVTLSAAACGGSSAKQATPDPTGVIDPDAGPPQADAGEGDLPPDPLDTHYPAAHTPIPLADYTGGPILKNAKIVTITFDGDTKRDLLEQLGDTITQTKWWDAVTDGYCDDKNTCVGQGSSGGHVHLSDPPAKSYTDSAFSTPTSIQDFIKAHVADGSFPTPDADTLYAIYFPSSVSIVLDSANSCMDFGAYHNSVTITPPEVVDGGVVEGGVLGAPVDVAYAIMPRCGNSTGELTLSASHEFIEAATDPHVGNPAYYMQNQVWTAGFGGEVGDLCELGFNGSVTYVESSFIVQRSWSNKAAAGSHDPCVPAPVGNGPYFNVAPNTPIQATNAIAIKVGSTKVIPLTAFSDAAMDDWTLEVQETTHYRGGSDVLGGPSGGAPEVDRSLVHNGSKINLSITLTARPSQGQATFELVSRSGNVTHTWPMAVRAQ